MISRFFSHRIVGMALVLSFGVGTLFVSTMQSMRAEHWAYQQRNNANLVTTLAKSLEWNLDSLDQGVQKMVWALEQSQVLEQPGQPIASAFDSQRPLWRDFEGSDFFVLDARGKLVYRTFGTQSMGENFFSQDFVQAFVSEQHQDVFIGLPSETLVIGKQVLPVARAVRASWGGVSGIVVGTLNLSEVNMWLRSTDFGAQSGINIIRADGHIVTRFPYSDQASNQSLAGSDNLARFLSAPSGSFVSTAVLDRIKRMYTHALVGTYPLIVNVAQSTRSIERAWLANAWLLGAFALLLMAGCIALAMMFSRELQRRGFSEAALFAEKERMQLTLQSIGDAVVCTDAQARITYLNAVAQQMLGVDLPQVLHQPVEALHVGSSKAGYAPFSPLRQALAQQQAIERMRVTLEHHASGKVFAMEETACLVRGPDGQVLGAVAVLRDITLAAAQEAHLQQLAFHDALTGLANRSLLAEKAQQALRHAQSTGQQVAVMYLDLDGFKSINDSWGHEAGDAAIVHAAHYLLAQVGVGDTVCRLGGDEFVVLLTELSPSRSLQHVVDKVQRLEAQPWRWNARAHALKFSGGVALYPEHATQWSELLRCADSAMYAAKQAGRCQIRMYQKRAAPSLLV